MWAGQVSALGSLVKILVVDRSRENTLDLAVANILEMAPQEFALAGLSQGGVLALEIAKRAPERVQKLALLDTTSKPDTPEADSYRRDAIKQTLDGDFEGVLEGFLPRLVADARLEDMAFMLTLRQMVLDTGPIGYINEQKQMLGRAGHEDFLKNIKVPTVVVCGEEDKFFSIDDHAEMARAIPGAEFHVIKGAGHMAPMEKPDAVNRILADWLRA